MTEPKRYTISASGPARNNPIAGTEDEDGQWIFDPDHKINLDPKPIEGKNRAILKTSHELIEYLKQYPDIEVDVHANNCFRVEFKPPSQVYNKPFVSIVGINHKD